MNITNYELISNATKQAQDLLNDYSRTLKTVIDSKSDDILEQIASYLYEVGNNCGFIEVNAIESSCIDSRYGGGEIEVISGPYTVNGIYYDWQLFCRAYVDIGGNRRSGLPIRIYINKTGYTIDKGNSDAALVYVCKRWKDIKNTLNSCIDNYFRRENQRIQRDAAKLHDQEQAINNFEL